MLSALCQHMHQDIFLLYGDFEGAIKVFRDDYSAENIAELTTEIEAIISSPKADSALERDWQACGAQIYPMQGYMREFLREIIRLLKA